MIQAAIDNVSKVLEFIVEVVGESLTPKRSATADREINVNQSRCSIDDKTVTVSAFPSCSIGCSKSHGHLKVSVPIQVMRLIVIVAVERQPFTP
jgi:hypothetical protein